jgi:hypothetical protein
LIHSKSRLLHAATLCPAKCQSIHHAALAQA